MNKYIKKLLTIISLYSSDEKIADKRLHDLKSGKEKIIPADIVFKELGL